ncbi:Zn-dependent exopeptidase [Phanerochaete sordida]|uniref:Peptide hydrolase n=1 Tax=Phanerochaete sordida TaxID=48140 RepID=A0A9P3G4K5_9APHY|nr:Zn-dependent exopeptidase [Phanerochaete sordida]
MLAKSLVPLALLMFPRPPGESPNSCLSFYGSSPTGKWSFYGTDDLDCVAAAASYGDSGALADAAHPPDTRLVWLESDVTAVDDSLRAAEAEVDVLSHLLASIKSSSSMALDGQQRILDGSEPREPVEAMYRDHSGSALLLRVDAALAPTLDTHLPRLWRSMLVPSSPAPFVPVPDAAIERVRTILKHVKFDPTVASLVNNISVPLLRADARWLTGEDSRSPIVSRHSFSSDTPKAAAWLVERFEETGATCRLAPFLTGFAPNVICAYPATTNTTETVLLSAHYDSRGSFGSTRAPGGDDDGSGTTALLGIARAIQRRGVRFAKNVQLCAFAGEEQGLLGSRAYARELREAGANLTLMVQADMLAYHKAGEPPQLGLPDLIGTPEVTQLVANLSAIYSPELNVGFTPACCSDHQSFHEQGFPSTQVFERAGPIADPMYHNSGDLTDREGYDFEQLKSIAKVQFATLLHSAGYEVPADEA